LGIILAREVLPWPQAVFYHYYFTQVKPIACPNPEQRPAFAGE